MPWPQRYDPFGSQILSTLVALAPVVLLLGLLASRRVRAEWAAVAGLAASIAVAVVAIGMPAGMAVRAALMGAAYGLFPIGWILLNVLFLYRLTVEQGAFDVLQRSIAQLTADKRLQLVLIAFSFGAFFEGAAGFGSPGLRGLGGRPLRVVAAPKAEPAVFDFNWLSASGTGIALTALIGGLLMGCRPAQMARAYAGTLRRIGPSLLTISAMMALGYVTRYSGTDSILGLAFAHAGFMYPFFGTFLGWLGVAL